MKKQKNQPPQNMVPILLSEPSCDMLTKMMIAYVLNMPKGDKYYYEKVGVVVEFMEECLPAHAGAFAMYFKVLDLMPATVKRKLPEAMGPFILDNREEIEKWYEGKLPDKYVPSAIITQDKRIVDAAGLPIESMTSLEATLMGTPPKKLELVL